MVFFPNVFHSDPGLTIGIIYNGISKYKSLTSYIGIEQLELILEANSMMFQRKSLFNNGQEDHSQAKLAHWLEQYQCPVLSSFCVEISHPRQLFMKFCLQGYVCMPVESL